jgi:hypothetical protein
MTSRRAIVTDIERDLKGFQEPQARGASNTPGAQDSVGGRGTTQAASTQLETHGVQLRHCDQILTLAVGRLRCSPCAYSEAIIAVIMTAMPLPSPPLCRFPGGTAQSTDVQGGGSRRGASPWHCARHFCLPPQNGGQQGRYLIFFRGLWQPTE